MSSDPVSILLLCDVRPNTAAQIRYHVDALYRWSRHRVRLFNPVGLRSSRLLDLEEFDAVAIHYSVFVSLDEYLAPAFREELRRYPGLKLQFIQDDYRRVDERAAAARDLGIRVLFTLYPEADIPRVWSERLPGVSVVSTLAGYVPDNLVGRAVPALHDRAIDVGYRGREMPWWLGRAAVDKVRIGEEFQRRSPAYGLRCDIRWDEDSRLYGGGWERFLAGCRAVLGTESGATITDFDGSVERGVHAYLELHPGAGFEEVSREILAPHEGNLPLLVISARMFEAAVLRTPMVLFPGRYSGILEPERHYIPLAEDFSNMDEVAARLRDHAGLSALAERTHREIVESGRYSHRVMVREFDDLVSSHLGVPRRRAAPRATIRPRACRTVGLAGPADLAHRGGPSLGREVGGRRPLSPGPSRAAATVAPLARRPEAPRRRGDNRSRGRHHPAGPARRAASGARRRAHSGRAEVRRRPRGPVRGEPPGRGGCGRSLGWDRGGLPGHSLAAPCAGSSGTTPPRATPWCTAPSPAWLSPSTWKRAAATSSAHSPPSPCLLLRTRPKRSRRPGLRPTRAREGHEAPSRLLPGDAPAAVHGAREPARVRPQPRRGGALPERPLRGARLDRSRLVRRRSLPLHVPRHEVAPASFPPPAGPLPAPARARSEQGGDRPRRVRPLRRCLRVPPRLRREHRLHRGPPRGRREDLRRRPPDARAYPHRPDGLRRRRTRPPDSRRPFSPPANARSTSGTGCGRRPTGSAVARS